MDNRHSFDTKNDEGSNGDRYTRNERERSKMKHENNEERGNNNYRDSNPDNNEQKIKLSDYFQTRGWMLVKNIKLNILVNYRLLFK